MKMAQMSTNFGPCSILNSVKKLTDSFHINFAGEQPHFPRSINIVANFCAVKQIYIKWQNPMAIGMLIGRYRDIVRK